MAKKQRTPEERERRAKMASFLQDLNVSSVADVQNLFKELTGNVLENGLEGELDEELGYSKYDYRKKNIKALMADLKAVYAAVDESTAIGCLEDFAEKWDTRYPKIASSWRDNWAKLSAYFKYPQEVRTLLYTTNAIEGFNRQLRKVTKSKSVFPTDDSLLKMLYLAMMDITKKWTGRRREWGIIHSQLEVYFADRIR